MSSTIEVQLHLWPWSTGIREETVNLITGADPFPFYGSPVISVSSKASLFLPQRYEKFIPFGPSFDTLGGECRLYEAPHGVIANRLSLSTNVGGEIRIRTKDSREIVNLLPLGAKPRCKEIGNQEGGEETLLARVIVSWSQFFDDLIEITKKTRREYKLPWSDIGEIIFRIAEEIAEPRMALIVDIAQRMHTRLSIIVNAARRILFRERRMLPAGNVAEMDTVCLRWVARQSGETIAEKAAANRQRLLGIARRESFNTLENRVLKDFLFRCAHEGSRYLNTEVGNDRQLQNSTRAQTVRKYRCLSAELHQAPHLERLGAPPPAPRPNYVLQNDYRYKQIWNQYVRLLKQEDEEDRLWDWQARTWADISRFLVNAAIYDLSRSDNGASKAPLLFEELLASAIHLLGEQHLGGRMAPGSEPGPFMVRRKGAGRDQASVLEIVHSSQAGEHPATRFLGRLGGHLFLVLTPLFPGRRSVVVIWAVHTAGADKHPAWEDIGRSAGVALQSHVRILDDSRIEALPRVHGFVIASSMESNSAELHPAVGQGLHLVQVATEQRCWRDALAGITAVLEVIIEKIL